MSDENPNDKNLINFIATTVETMRDQMATKDDLDKMVTKADLGEMVTKADLGKIGKEVEYTGGQVETLRHQVGSIRDQMATKNGLAGLETAIRGDFEQVHLRFDTIERAISTGSARSRRKSAGCAAWSICW